MLQLDIYYDWHKINEYFDFNKEFKRNIINQLNKCIKKLVILFVWPDSVRFLTVFLYIVTNHKKFFSYLPP